MKLNAKTRSTLVIILAFAMIIGTLSWEIIERLLLLAGAAVDLTVGPIELDVHVVAVTFRPNPGTLIGVYPGITIFRRA